MTKIENKRVLIVGVGSIGERHLRCFAATGRARMVLCELNPKLRDEVAKRYGVTECFADLAQTLRNPPDVAVVATPAQTHIPIAQQLAEAGVHLLIEKPLSTSPAGIDKLMDTVRTKHLTAAVAYVHRANPILAAMKNALAQGRFGKPVHLVAVTGQNFPTYRPAYRDIYYKDHATGGGAIQDALTHVINAGEWLIGPVDRLVADAAHQVLEGVQVEDTVGVLARHGGALANYSLNQHQAPNEVNITVVCDRGTMRLELFNHRWRWMTEPGGDWHDEPFPALERDTLFTTQANAFLDAVQGKAQPLLCTLEQGLQTLRVNLATLQSVADGKWHTIKDGDQ